MTMLKRLSIVLALGVFAILPGCKSSTSSTTTSTDALTQSTAPRIYVTNEVSGDLSVIDSASLKVITTVPLGKRPRGIHSSPDHKTLYVALSGTPIAGPDVDESTLPPPDKSADGIGVFDVVQNKVVRMANISTSPTKTSPP
jgi:YVTN family beta-propeller protein